MKPYFAAAIVALAFSPASPLFACAWNPPVNIGDARIADLIFEGTLTDRTLYSLPDRPTEVAFITATFSVLSVLKGEPGPEVTVVIANQMLGVPVDLNALPDRVFVATVDSPPESYLPSGVLPDLPQLLHPTCGTGFIIPATQENRADIVNVLSTP